MTKIEPIEETTVNSTNEIVKDEASIPPINIKMEEPLMINESLETDYPEELPQNDEIPVDSHERNLDTTTKSLQGCLNDIGEIFKDAAPIKPNSPDKGKSVNIKLTPPTKKTLVRCLDSNGKIIFAELQVDPNNPKNIKIVKTPNVIASQHPGGVNGAKPKNFVQLKVGTTVDSKQVALSTNVSNAANRIIKVHPIASTMANPKPMIIINPSMSRPDAVGTKMSAENKKVFFIKSPSSLNLNSSNPPPLVKISDPGKVALTSNLKTNQTNESNRKLTLNPNNVIMKNGKIIILDRDKPTVKPKQESLLKPQFSLLKPLVQKQLNDTSSAKSILIQKPSPQLLGNRIRKQTPTIMPTVVKRDYQKEFGTIFLRHRFQSVRSATEYVLRNTPLVNKLASRPEFSAAFPFVVETEEKFNSFPFAKRRSNEVMRRMLDDSPPEF